MKREVFINNRVMEPETIKKNGAGSKSHTIRENYCLIKELTYEL
jgi:hypothetical protein